MFSCNARTIGIEKAFNHTHMWKVEARTSGYKQQTQESTTKTGWNNKYVSFNWTVLGTGYMIGWLQQLYCLNICILQMRWRYKSYVWGWVEPTKTMQTFRAKSHDVTLCCEKTNIMRAQRPKHGMNVLFPVDGLPMFWKIIPLPGMMNQIDQSICLFLHQGFARGIGTWSFPKIGRPQIIQFMDVHFSIETRFLGVPFFKKPPISSTSHELSIAMYVSQRRYYAVMLNHWPSSNTCIHIYINPATWRVQDYFPLSMDYDSCRDAI